MAADCDDLKATFRKGVRFFNQHNFTLNSYSDYAAAENVRMKKLDDEGYHEGIDDVENYFYTKGNQDQASFIPDDDKDSHPAFVMFDGYGFVSGTATFVDRTNPIRSPERRIAYSFTYISVNDEWRAIHLWGTYIPRNTGQT
jgi:hypothetical protein